MLNIPHKTYVAIDVLYFICGFRERGDEPFLSQSANCDEQPKQLDRKCICDLHLRGRYW